MSRSQQRPAPWLPGRQQHVTAPRLLHSAPAAGASISSASCQEPLEPPVGVPAPSPEPVLAPAPIATPQPDPFAWLHDPSRRDPRVLRYLQQENEYCKIQLRHLGPLRKQLEEELAEAAWRQAVMLAAQTPASGASASLALSPMALSLQSSAGGADVARDGYEYGGYMYRRQPLSHPVGTGSDPGGAAAGVAAGAGQGQAGAADVAAAVGGEGRVRELPLPPLPETAFGAAASDAGGRLYFTRAAQRELWCLDVMPRAHQLQPGSNSSAPGSSSRGVGDGHTGYTVSAPRLVLREPYGQPMQLVRHGAGLFVECLGNGGVPVEVRWLGQAAVAAGNEGAGGSSSCSGQGGGQGAEGEPPGSSSSHSHSYNHSRRGSYCHGFAASPRAGGGGGSGAGIGTGAGRAGGTGSRNCLPDWPVAASGSGNGSSSLQPPGPLLLRVHGAYGLDPGLEHQPAMSALLRRGVAVAVAHVRGGGFLGPAWRNRQVSPEPACKGAVKPGGHDAFDSVADDALRAAFILWALGVQAKLRLQELKQQYMLAFEVNLMEV
eukprot:XP_001698394.1 predicted protein [Chlamydomonas reinhardtii]